MPCILCFLEMVMCFLVVATTCLCCQISKHRLAGQNFTDGVKVSRFELLVPGSRRFKCALWIQSKVEQSIKLRCLSKIFATLHDRTTGPAANLIILIETCPDIPILCINNSSTRSITIYLIPHVHPVT